MPLKRIEIVWRVGQCYYNKDEFTVKKAMVEDVSDGSSPSYLVSKRRIMVKHRGKTKNISMIPRIKIIWMHNKLSGEYWGTRRKQSGADLFTIVGL